VRELLNAGEDAHVDYKQVVPKVNDFAKSLCAAANTVALRSDTNEFVFLIGVQEEGDPGGVVSGRVTGLVDQATGQVRDIEREKKAIVDASHQVVPYPAVEIDECGTASRKPFLAVRVQPTEAPHRVGYRYLVRKGSHNEPLEAHQLRRMFFDARAQAFIEELDGDNRITELLRVLLSAVSHLSTEVSSLELDLADDRRQVVVELEYAIERIYERLRDEMASAVDLSDLATEVDQAKVAAEDLYRPVHELLDRLSSVESTLSIPTIETARWEVAQIRRTYWEVLCSWRRRGELPDDMWSAGSTLFESFMFDDVSALGSESVFAEYVGWKLDGRGRTSDSARRILDAACRAAVEAALRGRTGPAWMGAELEGYGYSDQSWLIDMANRESWAPPEHNPNWVTETALLRTAGERLRVHVEALGATPFELHGGILVFRLQDCRVEMRLSESAAALLLHPNPQDDRFPDSTEFLRQLRRRLKRTGFGIVRGWPATAGQLAPLAGQRRPRPADGGTASLIRANERARGDQRHSPQPRE
jgi:hypothetical protein